MGLLRSALFSASILPRGKEKEAPLLNNVPVRIDGGALGGTLLYSGPRLTQRHSLVWQAVICAARAAGVGDNDRFLVPADQLLSMIGSAADDQHQRRRLWQTLSDLSKAHIAYTSKRVDYAGTLVSSVVHDTKRRSKDETPTGWLAIRLNADLTPYLSDEVLFNDLRRKARLGKNYLACWLHDYIATHKVPPAKSVAAIRTECGSTTKQLRDFRSRLKAAMNHLMGGDEALVQSWSLDEQDRLVVVKKAETKVKLLPIIRHETSATPKKKSWQEQAATAARERRAGLNL